ncbi:antirestriction protein ArdC [Mucilaginibacter sp. UYP25]|uniref:ArdC family protein n=1 Tax=unclassified Mucilaginibacter TaxID=2617802 RepID=UPI0033978FC9
MATTAQQPTQTNTFVDTYQEVTDAVIKALEEGTIIWQCPWNQVGLPKNITTNVNYRGWNLFLLNFHSMIKGYPTPYYITYKQAQKLGGIIKKGERGIRIIYWAEVELKNQSAEANQQPKVDEATKPRMIMVPKAYTVFNIAQTEDIEFPAFEAKLRSDVEIIQACEDVIANMPNKPIIRKNGTNAYYQPTTDIVVVPSLKKCKSNEAYYSTLFHELAHSTGHESRLNRKELLNSDGLGSATYAKEELTAEMTAAFLGAITGIGQATIDNSAAYIESWLKALKNDKTLVIKAAAQAQRAADYIMSVTYQPA